MILPAQLILARHEEQTKQGFPLLDPFVLRTVHPGTGMSYGLSSCGYDLRIREELLLAPGAFTLASTLEKFHMPVDLVGTIHDKSTLARLGLATQNTVAEPGWCGYLTLELTNHSQVEIGLMAGQPIAQVMFHMLAGGGTGQPYGDGKYQNQPARPVPALREK